MYRLMILQFLRKKFTLSALAVLLAAGVISIVVGDSFLKNQQKAIDETAMQQQEKAARLVKIHGDEMGLLLYYLKFAYVNPTSKLAALNIGQRDVNSGIQFPTIRTLEGQKYDTDIQNPYRLMMGNFDLSFVILFLFPLVIIGLSYNLFSEEKENGTWPLIRSQPISRRLYLLTKLSVPFLFISGVFLFLAFLASIIIGIPLHQDFFGFVVSAFLYISFWFAGVLLVTSFFKGSSTNAIILLSTWITLVVLLPAAANTYISAKYPVPESLSTMMKQRNGYHQKWDIPEDSTMVLFFKEYPEYASVKWTHKGFNWLWYYAMQHLGDVDARTDSYLFLNKLKARQALSETISWLVPSLYTQLYSSELAQSSLSNHIQFLQSTTDFHEQLRKDFYPRIFSASPVNMQEWKYSRPVYFDTRMSTTIAGSLYLGIFIIVLGGIGFLRINRPH